MPIPHDAKNDPCTTIVQEGPTTIRHTKCATNKMRRDKPKLSEVVCVFSLVPNLYSNVGWRCVLWCNLRQRSSSARLWRDMPRKIKADEDAPHNSDHRRFRQGLTVQIGDGKQGTSMLMNVWTPGSLGFFFRRTEPATLPMERKRPNHNVLEGDIQYACRRQAHTKFIF